MLVRPTRPLSAAVVLAVLIVLPALAEDKAPTGARGARSATRLPDGVEFITSVEGIEEYRLENGLRVLLFPDPSRRTTTVNITYLVGSAHEGYGERGMAHLLEHMVFKGSVGHPDIPAELTSHGCRPNGSTWYDRTNYHETFAATEENLAWALDLEADRMVNSFISKEDLDSEFSVVRNEFEAGENDPQSVLMDRIVSTAYLWHNYGNSTIGNRSDIERVPVDRLQAFYEKWYQPDNAVLVIAGKFDPDKTLALTREKFGRIPRPERPLDTTYTVEPAQDGERAVTLRRVGDAQAVGVAYHVPAGSHPDFPAVDVLAHVLGDTPSGRLYREIVESKQATSVFAWAMQFKEPCLLYLHADLREDGAVDAVRDDMLRVAEGVIVDPPTAEEVNRAKQDLLREWELTLRDSPRAAIRLSEWSAMGDWRFVFIHRDRLNAVTPEDVHRVAKAYLQPTNRTVGMFIPTKEPARTTIAPAPDVAEQVKEYVGGEAMAAGEDFDPTPESIEARLVRSTLPSGLKVWLLPKGTRARAVNLTLRLHFGDEQTLRNRKFAAGVAGGMLMRGTKSRTRQEIEDEVNRLRARVNVSGGATAASATAEGTRETLPDILRLVAEILREPAFPKSEFDLLIEEELRGAEDSRHDPGYLANNRLARHLTPYPREDVRYTPTIDEQIEGLKSVSLDEVREFHRRFYGASAGEIAVVGDFDSEEIAPLLEELFGDWKSREPFARLEEAYAERPPIAEAIETPDKESAVFRAGLRIKMRDDHPDYPALVLANFMTGGGFLNSRLATRIRQNEGLSYGVRSWFGADRWDEDASFGGWAIYAPQNDEKLVNAFREEIRRILEAGFTEEEIAEAKSGWLQGRTVSRSQDRELAWQLVERAYGERTLAWDSQLEGRIGQLSGPEIADAFRRHIDPAKISMVRAGDFAKGKASGEHASLP
jgi:zinc protease